MYQSQQSSTNAVSTRINNIIIATAKRISELTKRNKVVDTKRREEWASIQVMDSVKFKIDMSDIISIGNIIL